MSTAVGDVDVYEASKGRRKDSRPLHVLPDGPSELEILEPSRPRVLDVQPQRVIDLDSYGGGSTFRVVGARAAA